MTIRLDHTIVPATDKVASAAFFADIFGLTIKPGQGHFAQVQVNESLTLDFADEPEPWGGPGFDPRTGRSHHYAFHVSEEEFDAIVLLSDQRYESTRCAIQKAGGVNADRTDVGSSVRREVSE